MSPARPAIRRSSVTGGTAGVRLRAVEASMPARTWSGVSSVIGTTAAAAI